METEYQNNLTLYKPPPSKDNRNGLKEGNWIYSPTYFRNEQERERNYNYKWLVDYVDSEIIAVKIGKGYCSVPLKHSEYRYHGFKIVDENFQPNKIAV